MLIFYTDLVLIVQNKGQPDAIYTDLRKAFDYVNHYILIQILSIMGITDPILKLFHSYLSLTFLIRH